MTAVADPHVDSDPAFTGEVHPLADLWPILDDDELQALADDIAEHGQRQPIIIDAFGRLVDGRNRLAACGLADVEPEFVLDPELSTDEEVAAYIGSANAERRHLSTGQQAMGRALMLQAQGRRKDGRWVRGTFANDQSLDRSAEVALSKCGVILDWAPDLAELVMRPTSDPQALSLDAAYKTAKVEQDEATEAERAEKARQAEAARQAAEDAKRLADLRETAPDLADLVDGGGLALKEAVAAYRERTRKAREAEMARLDGIRKANVAVTEAVFRLSLFPAHPNNLPQWVADYDPAQVIHPLTREQVGQAIVALTALREVLPA